MEELKIQILNRIKDSEEHIFSIKENASDILDIAYAPGLQREVSDILISECKSILNRINSYELNINGIKRLLEQISSTQSDKSSDEVMEEISLRPTTISPHKNNSRPHIY